MFPVPGSRARPKPYQSRQQIAVGVRSRGAVRMFPISNIGTPSNNIPTQGAGTWIVLDPFGNEISTKGTTTSGLQEAINAAVYNGWPLEVRGHGGTRLAAQACTTNGTTSVTVATTIGLQVNAYVTGVNIPSFTQITAINSATSITISNAATSSTTLTLTFSINPIFISCTTGIVFPPAEQWSARFYDVNITFGTGVTGPCFQFDSCMIVDVGFYGGQLVGQPSVPGPAAYLIYFNPTNPVPLDGIITITGSRFHFSNLAYSATGGTNVGVIGANCSLGSIDNSFFASQELNGTGVGSTPNTQNGFVVFGPSSNTSFEENIIDFSDVHLATSAGIQVGVSSANANNLCRNVYRIGGIRPGSSATGISTFGSYDIFQVGAITNEEASGGSLQFGINYQAGSVGNMAQVGQFSGVTTNVIDSGSGNSVFSNGTLAIGTSGAVFAGTQTVVSQAGNVSPRVQVVSSGAQGALGAIRTGAPGGGGALVALSGSRGTVTSPSAVLNGDGLGSVVFSGDTGVNLNQQAATIVVTAVGTFSTASLPSQMSFKTTSSGSVTTTEALRLDTFQNTINLCGRSDLSYVLSSPSTGGFSLTVSSSNYTTIIDPAGTVSSATITMASSPVDGQINKLVTSQAITTLTVAANTGQAIKGAPTTLAAGGRIEAIFRAASTTWYV